jgi:tetratricopeptide (TPR) repeat protein
MLLALAPVADADEATWKTLTDQAAKHQSVENFGQAEKFAREAVFEADKTFGENDARTADSLDVLARILVFSGKPIEAEIQWRRVLRIRSAVLGPEARTMAVTYVNIASAMIRSGQITENEAEAMFARALAIFAKTDGVESRTYAAALYGLGSARLVLGQYATAEEALTRALAIREKADGPDSLEVSRTLNVLALAVDRQGKAEAAKAYRERSLAILNAATVDVRK